MAETINYPLETHYVETKDGYIVTLIRVLKAETTPIVNKDDESEINIRREGKSKPAVLLANGMATNGDEWLLNKEGHILPHRLLDEGYDCWLACYRGSRLSNDKPHKTLTKDSRKYWDYSIDDIGEFDISAMIDYILEATSNDSIYYIGASLGCVVFFLLMSLKPEYNSKIKMMVALAPANRRAHCRNISSVVGAYSVFSLSKFKIFHQRGFFLKPLYTHREFLRTSWSTSIDAFSLKIYSRMIGLIGNESFEKERMEDILKSFPGPASVKTFCHFSQLFVSGKFQAFDYGRSENIKKYGTPKPPEYDLQKTTAPVVTFGSTGDQLVPAEDVLHTSKQLPNLVNHYEIKESQFAHVDFVIGKAANKLVYDIILNLFNKNEE